MNKLVLALVVVIIIAWVLMVNTVLMLNGLGPAQDKARKEIFEQLRSSNGNDYGRGDVV